MEDDPIVAEVRAIRDELARRCCYDIKEVFRQLRQQQSSSGRKYVRYPARRIVPTENEQTFETDSSSVCISSCTSSTSPLICLRRSVAPGRSKMRAVPNSRWIIDCCPGSPALPATAPPAGAATAAAHTGRPPQRNLNRRSVSAMLGRGADRLQLHQSLTRRRRRFRQLAYPLSHRPVGQAVLLAVRLSRLPALPPRFYVPAPIVTTFSHRSSSEERWLVIQILVRWDSPVAYIKSAPLR